MVQQATPFVNGKLILGEAKERFAEHIAASIKSRFKRAIPLLELSSPGGSLLPRLLLKLDGRLSHIMFFSGPKVTPLLAERLNKIREEHDLSTSIVALNSSQREGILKLLPYTEQMPEVLLSSFSLHESLPIKAKAFYDELLNIAPVKLVYITDAYTPFEGDYFYVFFQQLYHLIHHWAGVEAVGRLWRKSEIIAFINDVGLRPTHFYESYIDVPFDVLRELFQEPHCAVSTLRVILKHVPFAPKEDILRLPVITVTAMR